MPRLAFGIACLYLPPPRTPPADVLPHAGQPYHSVPGRLPPEAGAAVPRAGNLAALYRRALAAWPKRRPRGDTTVTGR